MKYIDSIKELLFLYFVVLIISSLAYSGFEGKDFFESFWWACITAMTVGYGDMYPVTLGGKIIALLLIHISVLLILPLLIGNVCSRCVKNQNEFTHEEQEELKTLLRAVAEKEKLI